MFPSDRFQPERNKKTGLIEWFVRTREGLIGAFESKLAAGIALERHIEHCMMNSLDGGRELELERPSSRSE
jgi:hypothetical protein